MRVKMRVRVMRGSEDEDEGNARIDGEGLRILEARAKG